MINTKVGLNLYIGKMNDKNSVFSYVFGVYVELQVCVRRTALLFQ
jgi:hypothetical protein